MLTLTNTMSGHHLMVVAQHQTVRPLSHIGVLRSEHLRIKRNVVKFSIVFILELLFTQVLK